MIPPMKASMTDSVNSPPSASPNPEVSVSGRCRFSGADKQRILEAADRCADSGEVGALLRREVPPDLELERFWQVAHTALRRSS
jgi:transposase